MVELRRGSLTESQDDSVMDYCSSSSRRVFTFGFYPLLVVYLLCYTCVRILLWKESWMTSLKEINNHHC